MHAKQQELVSRLKKAMNDISRDPETEAEVIPLLRDLVISFEEIASDLKQTSDQEIAAILKAAVKAVSQGDSVDQVAIAG